MRNLRGDANISQTVDPRRPYEERGSTITLETALFSRLELFTRLSNADKAALSKLVASTQLIPARRDLISEGDPPVHVNLVLEGWGGRYKTLPNGKRSLVSFLIPGDFCNLSIYVLKQMDHTKAALTALKVAAIEPDSLLTIMRNHPRVTEALLWHQLVSAAVQREWTHNLGVRPAYERLAHLFVELFFRMRSVGLAEPDGCEFPLTQYDLAEATGLTPVHVNRSLQSLRADGLVEIERRRLIIPDLGRLMEVSMFNPNYLHLEREGAYLDAND